ncbi:MAG: MgtC/SapB family protein [Lachnospiraceae bacterium]|nr:MgtC/SapB family protein [Lachnospiraceae bacterium]
MISLFNGLRGVTILSVGVKMLLAVLCGGVIGIEREYKRRPAGFRTHILVCLGGCMTTLTSLYLFLVMHYNTDIARMGAQVIAGIGFIGAGTIIVTGRQRVKGLTTAAGLWASAIVGLSIGAGYYEGAVATTLGILVAEIFFSRWESRVLDRVPIINLYLEYTDREILDRVLALYRGEKVKILHMEITRNTGNNKHNACAIFSLLLNKNIRPEKLIEMVGGIEGTISVEEL